MKSIIIFFNTLFDSIFLLFYKSKIVKKKINFFLNQKIAYLVSILLIVTSILIIVFSFKRILVLSGSIVFNFILIFNILFGIIMVIIFLGLILKEAKPTLFRTYKSKYYSQIEQIEKGFYSEEVKDEMFVNSKNDLIRSVLIKKGIIKDNGGLIFPNDFVKEQKDIGILLAKFDEQNLLHPLNYNSNGNLNKTKLHSASKKYFNFY